jgi:quercetin dioxygenase-like cupin family protein
MTAPQPRFVPPAGGPVVGIVGDVYTRKASGADTGGAFALYEFVVSPGGGPPPHVHSREDEGFWVLEGEVTFEVAGRAFVVGAGGFIYGPRDVPHRFQNRGTAPRMLCLIVPAGLERFFDEVGHPLPDASAPVPPVTPADIERMLAKAPEYGITILPPDRPSGPPAG